MPLYNTASANAAIPCATRMCAVCCRNKHHTLIAGEASHHDKPKLQPQSAYSCASRLLSSSSCCCWLAYTASVGGSNLLRSKVKVLLQFWSRSRHTPTSASACTVTAAPHQHHQKETAECQAVTKLPSIAASHSKPCLGVPNRHHDA